MNISITSTISLLLFSSVAHAQTGSLQPIDNANDLVTRIVGIGDVVIYLLAALAVVFIVYTSVIYFVKGKDGDENRHEAGMRIMWGIVGLFVIISIWGLVNILLNTFATNTTLPPNSLPSANFLNSNGSNSTGPGTQTYTNGAQYAPQFTR